MSENSLFGFESFAKEPFYVKVNADLVELARKFFERLPPEVRMADLACGTGLMTKLSYDMLKPKSVSLVDGSSEALAAAENELSDYSAGGANFAYFAYDVQQPLPIESGSIDVAFLTNSIHMLSDKEAAVGEAARIVRPGGYFAVNTTFYTGSYDGGFKSPWMKWVLLARNIMGEETYRQLRGGEKSEKAEAMQWLTPQEYGELLARHCFRILANCEQDTKLDGSALEAIAKYDEFVAGTFRLSENHSNPESYRNKIEVASEALTKAIKPLLEDRAEGYLSRRWLQIVAVRE